MTTAAFITIFPDIPRIITALAEWLACLVCILSTGRRITGMRLAAVSVCFLAVQSVYMTVTDGFEGVAWNLCMAGAVLFMYLFIRICAETTGNAAVALLSYRSLRRHLRGRSGVI